MKAQSCLSLLGLTTLLTLSGCCCIGKRSGTASVELFNHHDLSGWKHVLADPDVPQAAVWNVRDGMIVCKGEPLGFLYTDRSFTNFRMLVEYRWAPGEKPGNSGIFSRINPPRGALPRCVEVQLMHGSAGDVLTLQGMTIQDNQARFFSVKNHELAGDINGIKKIADYEKPAGSWNRLEFLAQGDRYLVWMNGEMINDVSGVELASGPVGLQSEGGEIHFRRVNLTPLP